MNSHLYYQVSLFLPWQDLLSLNLLCRASRLLPHILKRMKREYAFDSIRCEEYGAYFATNIILREDVFLGLQTNGLLTLRGKTQLQLDAKIIMAAIYLEDQLNYQLDVKMSWHTSSLSLKNGMTVNFFKQMSREEMIEYLIDPREEINV